MTLAFNPSYYGISLKSVCFQQPKAADLITKFCSLDKLSAVEDGNHDCPMMTKPS